MITLYIEHIQQSTDTGKAIYIIESFRSDYTNMRKLTNYKVKLRVNIIKNKHIYVMSAIELLLLIK